MRITQYLDALRKGGESLDRIRGVLESHLQAGADQDRRHITWKPESKTGQIQFQLRDSEQKSCLRWKGGEHSILEFWEDKERCGLTFHAPESVSWELKPVQLEKLATAKAAGFACAVGATAGLVIWLALNIAHKLMECPQEDTKATEEP